MGRRKEVNKDADIEKSTVYRKMYGVKFVLSNLVGSKRGKKGRVTEFGLNWRVKRELLYVHK